MAACGFFHTAAVTESGELWTWGLGFSGQLGQRDRESKLSPGKVEIGKDAHCKVTVAAAGRGHTVVVTENGDVWSCGGNFWGQLGTGDRERRMSPTRIPKSMFEGAVVLMIACGADHSVATTSAGRVWTWGGGGRSQLGLGDTQYRSVPTLLAPECFGSEYIVMVAAGDDHTLAVDRAEGDVWTWGYGGEGALGHNDCVDRAVPTLVRSDPAFCRAKVVLLAAGAHHSLAVAADGSIWTWGNGASGACARNSCTTAHTLYSRSRPSVHVNAHTPYTRTLITRGTPRPPSNYLSTLPSLPPTRACPAPPTHPLTPLRRSLGAGQLGHGDRQHRLKPTLLSAAAFAGG